MMQRNERISRGMVVLIGFCMITSLFTFIEAHAADVSQKWNVQSIFPAGESLYKEFVSFTEKVKVMTNNRLVITPHPVGAIVGYKEMFDSLKSGVLQGYYSAGAFQSGKEPAFSAFCDLPGGYDNVMQIDAWYYQKGGLKLLRDIHSKFGNYAVGTIFYGREVMPSKVPIRSMADLKGKKIRAPEGIVAKLITKLGASTVPLPGSEVFSALDKGVVELTDWGTRSMNLNMGFYDACKYSLEPGFHSMSALEFVVSTKAWNALPNDIQTALEAATREWSWNTVTRVMKEDAEAGAKLKALGVEIIPLPEGDYQKIRMIARDLWSEWGKMSPASQQVVDSQVAWLKELGLLK